jgi:hypothetical protein
VNIHTHIDKSSMHINSTEDDIQRENTNAHTNTHEIDKQTMDTIHAEND